MAGGKERLVRPTAFQRWRHMTFYTLFRLAVREDRNDIAEGALDTGLGVGPDINDVASLRRDCALKS